MDKVSCITRLMHHDVALDCFVSVDAINRHSRHSLIRNYYPMQRSTNALPNRVKMAVAALTRMAAIAARVLQDT